MAAGRQLRAIGDEQRLVITMTAIATGPIAGAWSGRSGAELEEVRLDAAASQGRTKAHRKLPVLREALTGHFEDHHAYICATMLRRVDVLSDDIAGLSAETGVDMTAFATAAHLVFRANSLRSLGCAGCLRPAHSLTDFRVSRCAGMCGRVGDAANAATPARRPGRSPCARLIRDHQTPPSDPRSGRARRQR
jgi:hypothetical protein